MTVSSFSRSRPVRFGEADHLVEGLALDQEEQEPLAPVDAGEVHQVLDGFGLGGEEVLEGGLELDARGGDDGEADEDEEKK